MEINPHYKAIQQTFRDWKEDDRARAGLNHE